MEKSIYLRPCGSFETLKVKLKLEIVYAVSIVSDAWYVLIYIHIDFKQADNNLRIYVTKINLWSLVMGKKVNIL
jgi:hypothetical protein